MFEQAKFRDECVEQLKNPKESIILKCQCPKHPKLKSVFQQLRTISAPNRIG